MRLRQPHISLSTFPLSFAVSFFHSVFLQRVALPHVASTHTYSHTAHAFMQRVERWLYTCNTLKRLTHFVNMTNPLSAYRPTSPPASLLLVARSVYTILLVRFGQWAAMEFEFLWLYQSNSHVAEFPLWWMRVSLCIPVLSKVVSSASCTLCKWVKVEGSLVVNA